ncbi:hypothetical protein OL229_14015 [Neisseriaceae bacterium JH1-16]|nr:hypothetical protein [Neisseriaceae bacterium JH1-16]
MQKKSLIGGLLAAAILLPLTACAYPPPNWQPPAPAPHWQGGPPPNWNPAQHPYYIHAMSDLRMARAYLARPDYDPVAHDERMAVNEIDAAIGLMRQAAFDDGKNPNAQFPIDAQLRPTDRFHQALNLLGKARQDAGHEESDPYLRDLQHRILQHIGNAQRAVNMAIGDALR